MQRRSAPSILLVEDNDAHAHLAEFFLKERSVAVRVDRARNGEEALAYLSQRRPDNAEGFVRGASAHPLPSLILLDVRLPKLDGLEVLRQIKTASDLSRIPVVMLSTSEAEADVEAAYALHANGYLVKPLDAAQFAAMIESLVTYWLTWNHLSQRHRSRGMAASFP